MSANQQVLIAGKGSDPVAPPGQALFDTPGQGFWTVPPGVYEASVVCIGAGGLGAGNRGGGGGLGYKNNISVNQGDQIPYQVGAPGVNRMAGPTAVRGWSLFRMGSHYQLYAVYDLAFTLCFRFNWGFKVWGADNGEPQAMVVNIAGSIIGDQDDE